MMFNTLYLNPVDWDLSVDAFGNIAMAEPSYSLVQDVCSAAKLFLGELYYDTTKGVPYFEDILGLSPPASLFAAHLEKAALTVSGVVSAQCIITERTAREIVGQIEFIDETGAENSAFI